MPQNTGPGPHLLGNTICMLAESPVWDERRQTLFWCDIPAGNVHGLHPESGKTTQHDFPAPVGSLGLCENGDLIVACGMEIHLLDPRTGQRRIMATIPNPQGLPLRLNDGKVGPDGAFWVGSMHDAGGPGIGTHGALWRVTAAGAECIETGLTCPNGLAFRADGSVMWHSDSMQKWVRRRPFDPATGTAEEGSVICRPTEASGRPDGGCTDLDGTYWSAGVSAGVLNAYDGDGTILRRIPMPVPHPTMCCFGGPDFRTMFITTHRHNMSPEQLRNHPGSGGIWFVRQPRPGFAAWRFHL